MPYDSQGIWKPHLKQAEFLSIPFDIKEAAYLGGAGSAKTELLLMFAIVHKLHENPAFKQVFLRRTTPELKNEVVPRSKQLYRPLGAKYNASDMMWTFPSGAIIKLGHCEHEDDVHQYDSMEISLFTPDEVTSLTWGIYNYIAFQRTRVPRGSGLTALVRAAGMPGGIGHNWVNNRFIKPYKPGGKVLIGKGGNKRIYIFATQADNPHVDPKYSQALESLPEAEKNAKKYGSFDAYIGQVFDEFRDRRYADEPDNALHVIEPFEIPEWWPKIFVGDWGFAANTWIGCGAISPDRRVILYRELMWNKVKIEVWANELKYFVDKEKPKIIKFCKSAGQDRGQEHTIQQQISEALGVDVELTQNNPGSRVATKLLLHEYLRFEPKKIIVLKPEQFNQELADRLFRNDINAYDNYLSQFVPQEPEKNLPKLLIFKNANIEREIPYVVDAIKACVYAKPKEGQVAEDVAEFEGDDPYDGIRYLVDSADQFFNTASNELEKIKRREEIVKMLQSGTGGMTAFYRNMERLESKSNVVKTVRRYRH